MLVCPEQGAVRADLLSTGGADNIELFEMFTALV